MSVYLIYYQSFTADLPENATGVLNVDNISINFISFVILYLDVLEGTDLPMGGVECVWDGTSRAISGADWQREQCLPRA